MYNYGSFTARSKYNQLNHFSIMDLIKSDVLRSKYIDAIVRHTDDMFDTFDRLSQHFKNFLDLKIGTGYSMDMKAQ